MASLTHSNQVKPKINQDVSYQNHLRDLTIREDNSKSFTIHDNHVNHAKQVPQTAFAFDLKEKSESQKYSENIKFEFSSMKDRDNRQIRGHNNTHTNTNNTNNTITHNTHNAHITGPNVFSNNVNVSSDKNSFMPMKFKELKSKKEHTFNAENYITKNKSNNFDESSSYMENRLDNLNPVNTDSAIFYSPHPKDIPENSKNYLKSLGNVELPKEAKERESYSLTASRSNLINVENRSQNKSSNNTPLSEGFRVKSPVIIPKADYSLSTLGALGTQNAGGRRMQEGDLSGSYHNYNNYNNNNNTKKTSSTHNKNHSASNSLNANNNNNNNSSNHSNNRKDNFRSNSQHFLESASNDQTQSQSQTLSHTNYTQHKPKPNTESKAKKNYSFGMPPGNISSSQVNLQNTSEKIDTSEFVNSYNYNNYVYNNNNTNLNTNKDSSINVNPNTKNLNSFISLDNNATSNNNILYPDTSTSKEIPIIQSIKNNIEKMQSNIPYSGPSTCKLYRPLLKNDKADDDEERDQEYDNLMEEVQVVTATAKMNQNTNGEGALGGHSNNTLIRKNTYNSHISNVNSYRENFDNSEKGGVNTKSFAKNKENFGKMQRTSDNQSSPAVRSGVNTERKEYQELGRGGNLGNLDHGSDEKSLMSAQINSSSSKITNSFVTQNTNMNFDSIMSGLNQVHSSHGKTQTQTQTQTHNTQMINNKKQGLTSHNSKGKLTTNNNQKAYPSHMQANTINNSYIGSSIQSKRLKKDSENKSREIDYPINIVNYNKSNQRQVHKNKSESISKVDNNSEVNSENQNTSEVNFGTNPIKSTGYIHTNTTSNNEEEASSKTNDNPSKNQVQNKRKTTEGIISKSKQQLGKRQDSNNKYNRGKPQNTGVSSNPTSQTSNSNLLSKNLVSNNTNTNTINNNTLKHATSIRQVGGSKVTVKDSTNSNTRVTINTNPTHTGFGFLQKNQPTSNTGMVNKNFNTNTNQNYNTVSKSKQFKERTGLKEAETNLRSQDSTDKDFFPKSNSKNSFLVMSNSGGKIKTPSRSRMTEDIIKPTHKFKDSLTENLNYYSIENERVLTDVDEQREKDKELLKQVNKAVHTNNEKLEKKEPSSITLSNKNSIRKFNIKSTSPKIGSSATATDSNQQGNNSQVINANSVKVLNSYYINNNSSTNTLISGVGISTPYKPETENSNSPDEKNSLLAGTTNSHIMKAVSAGVGVSTPYKPTTENNNSSDEKNSLLAGTTNSHIIEGSVSTNTNINVNKGTSKPKQGLSIISFEGGPAQFNKPNCSPKNTSLKQNIIKFNNFTSSNTTNSFSQPNYITLVNNSGGGGVEGKNKSNNSSNYDMGSGNNNTHSNINKSKVKNIPMSFNIAGGSKDNSNNNTPINTNTNYNLDLYGGINPISYSPNAVNAEGKFNLNVMNPMDPGLKDSMTELNSMEAPGNNTSNAVKAGMGTVLNSLYQINSTNLAGKFNNADQYIIEKFYSSSKEPNKGGLGQATAQTLINRVKQEKAPLTKTNTDNPNSLDVTHKLGSANSVAATPQNHNHQNPNNLLNSISSGNYVNAFKLSSSKAGTPDIIEKFYSSSKETNKGGQGLGLGPGPGHGQATAQTLINRVKQEKAPLTKTNSDNPNSLEVTHKLGSANSVAATPQSHNHQIQNNLLNSISSGNYVNAFKLSSSKAGTPNSNHLNIYSRNKDKTDNNSSSILNSNSQDIFSSNNKNTSNNKQKNYYKFSSTNPNPEKGGSNTDTNYNGPKKNDFSSYINYKPSSQGNIDKASNVNVTNVNSEGTGQKALSNNNSNSMLGVSKVDSGTVGYSDYSNIVQMGKNTNQESISKASEIRNKIEKYYSKVVNTNSNSPGSNLSLNQFTGLKNSSSGGNGNSQMSGIGTGTSSGP
eukprot:CAMPEP_0170538140 /NCGR_PEP_ID=MMETSP0209-20121228/103131_1 /TAXON_ID=665100 ORGANISM="Litonotus pictus, Strain P1" /NCGR_SAMPLE_ID=MMETSP0209 /ASSEMBLY_ACC=CAM_ASM_000301 /LENGTH=1880 /DNA_ID=CAMNT_0010839777 /DNA_START=540 /DNA_END=6180 /DNA_ORIENTATION=+